MDLNVLYCDDNRGLLKEFKRSLESDYAAVRVHTASRAADALRIVKSDHVGTAVLDIKMSPTDGIKLASRIKAAKKGIEIVFFTAYTNPKMQQKAAEAGITATWIDKSAGVKPLVNAVARMIAGKAQSVVGPKLAHLLAQKYEMPADFAVKFSADVVRELIRIPRTIMVDPPASPKARSHAAPSWDELFDDLVYYTAECAGGFRDPAIRHNSWSKISIETAPRLWRVAKASGAPKLKQRLVFMLLRGTAKVAPNLLTQSHLQVVRQTVAILRGDRVTEIDVDSCQDAWRSANISITPSLQPVLERWQYYYDVASLQETSRSPTGDVRSDGTSSRRSGPKKRNRQ